MCPLTDSKLQVRTQNFMNKLCSYFILVAISLSATISTGQTPATPTTPTRTVDSIVRQMTLDEKLDLLGGVDGFFIRDVPRLNLPRFKMADGPIGVRNFGPATAFAGGIALTASWNTTLAELVGRELGRDSR